MNITFSMPLAILLVLNNQASKKQKLNPFKDEELNRDVLSECFCRGSVSKLVAMKVGSKQVGGIAGPFSGPIEEISELSFRCS